MGKQTILHGITALALTFLIGTSCANNDGLKAQLAAQQQITQMQIAQLQAQYNSSLRDQKWQDYSKCVEANPNSLDKCTGMKPQ